MGALRALIKRREADLGDHDVKLNMGQAWSDATAMLGANRDTVAAIVGLFFFLPYFALAVFVPEVVNPTPVEAPPGTDPEVVMNAATSALVEQYANNWAYFLIFVVSQLIGTLCLLVLLTDRSRPTVGEALKQGVKSTPSYLAAQILTALFAVLVVGLPLQILGRIAPAPVTALLGLVMIFAVLYIFVKFALIAPVIAVEGELNPISAMRRSWTLTKGNSFRLASFFLLLIIAIGIVALLVTSVLSLVLSAFGESIANTGNGIVSGLSNAIVGALLLGVLAAVHRQLAGPPSEEISETFE